ncbi:MAG: GAF domain-containing protein [Bacteroidaceae bacterium]|nr:GAF domain-containing protein [Bacteroidaceae bacterium]
MAEEFHIAQGGKEEKYALLYKQIAALVEGESDIIANMANVSAMIHHTFGFWWTGFYRVIGEGLILGPFQGPLACSRIAYGRGVCGTAWKEARTQVVPDVEQYPGHIACSSASKSEIVVPLFKGGEVVAVLDIDSEHLATFDDTDRYWLEKIVGIM